jgi:hypothetical protein
MYENRTKNTDEIFQEAERADYRRWQKGWDTLYAHMQTSQ